MARQCSDQSSARHNTSYRDADRTSLRTIPSALSPNQAQGLVNMGMSECAAKNPLWKRLLWRGAKDFVDTTVVSRPSSEISEIKLFYRKMSEAVAQRDIPKFKNRACARGRWLQSGRTQAGPTPGCVEENRSE